MHFLIIALHCESILKAIITTTTTTKTKTVFLNVFKDNDEIQNSKILSKYYFDTLF